MYTYNLYNNIILNNRLTVHIFISEAIVEEVQFWLCGGFANSTDQDPTEVHYITNIDDIIANHLHDCN